jgi:hypothetical protein
MVPGIFGYQWDRYRTGGEPLYGVHPEKAQPPVGIASGMRSTLESLAE